MVSSYVDGKETRTWRNAFYGLPACYKPAAEWEACNGTDAGGCRKLCDDAKSLWASVKRSRKDRGVMA